MKTIRNFLLGKKADIQKQPPCYVGQGEYGIGDKNSLFYTDNVQHCIFLIIESDETVFVAHIDGNATVEKISNAINETFPSNHQGLTAKLYGGSAKFDDIWFNSFINVRNIRQVLRNRDIEITEEKIGEAYERIRDPNPDDEDEQKNSKITYNAASRQVAFEPDNYKDRPKTLLGDAWLEVWLTNASSSQNSMPMRCAVDKEGKTHNLI